MCYCVALEVQTCRYINVPPAPPCEVHVVPRITCISSAWQVIFGKSLGMFLSFSQSSEYFVEAKVLQKGRSNGGLGEDYMKYIWETDGKNAKTRQEEDGSNRNGCPKLFTNPLCVKRIIKYKFWKVNITRTEFFKIVRIGVTNYLKHSRKNRILCFGIAQLIHWRHEFLPYMKLELRNGLCININVIIKYHKYGKQVLVMKKCEE